MGNTHSKVECRTHDFDKEVVEVVEVDPKYRKFFVDRRAQQIRKISRENGGVYISFPRPNSKSNKVLLVGARNFVYAAKLAIMEVLTDQVVVQCIIPRIHHSVVKGVRGVNLHLLSREHSVWIEFPRCAANSVKGTKTGTGSGRFNEASVIKDTSRGDVILITGKEENCLRAKQALLALVPSDIAVKIPLRFYGLIIGRRGRNIASITNHYGVWIRVPPAEREKDWVRVRGPLHNCEKATVALLKRVEELQAREKARELRSHGETVQVSPEQELVQDEIAVDVEVPSRFHRAIIGERSENIRSLCDQFRVWILTPRPDLEKDLFRVLGAESNCEEAKEALVNRVKELQEEEERELRNHRETVRVCPRYHPYIIGPRLTTVNKIAMKHDVSIHFPRVDSLNNDQIIVDGNENKARAAIEEILNIVEEVEEISVQVDIDNSLHAGLVETRGKSLSKIMKNCEVTVFFPEEHGSNKVTITGMKKNVEVAKALLFVLAVNFMVDVLEQRHSTLVNTGGEGPQ